MELGRTFQLDKSVKSIMLQFRTRNNNVIPDWITRRPIENDAERKMRESNAAGVPILAPVKNISALYIRENLEESGYELVNAYAQERLDPISKNTYFMVRFLFVPKEKASIREEHKTLLAMNRGDLKQLCSEAMWTMETYKNPHRASTAEDPQSVILLYFKDRAPYLQPNGKPVVARKVKGVGQAVPVSPDYNLYLLGLNLIVTPIEQTEAEQNLTGQEA